MFLPLELTLRPSRVYLIALAAAHGLALLGIWMPALPLGIKVSATMALFAGAFHLWRESANRPAGLRVTQSGQVEILDGEWRPAQIKGQSIVLPWLVGLTLEVEGGQVRRIELFPDSADPDGVRKLRVVLKWAGTAD